MSKELPEEFAVASQRQRDPNASTKGKIFGLPLDNFGPFASLLIALSTGFIAFFLTTFVAIFAILFYNSSGHHAVDFAVAYKVIALPFGILVAAVSLFFLGFLWIRRKLTGNHGHPLDS